MPALRTETGSRAELLDRLADAVGSVSAGHPLRVAVDGPPAGGKTMLADEMAHILRAGRREVIRATIDNFMFPRNVRHRRGRDSPEVCYRDSFDYDALVEVLLDPLGPGGDRHYRDAVYDWHMDIPLPEPAARPAASENAVLLVDGVFLQRPELVDRWDLRIFVSTSFEQLIVRARVRDLSRLKSVAAVEQRFRDCYIPAQEMYFAEARPAERAHIVVHNDDVQRPGWELRPR